MLSATFLITNLHCPSCVSLIHDVLSPAFPGIRGAVDVSLIQQTISCSFDEKVTDVAQIASALTSSAFEVQHVTVLDHNGARVAEQDLGLPQIQSPTKWYTGARRAQRDHIDNCDACKKEKAQNMPKNSLGPKIWSSLIRSRKTSSVSSEVPVSSPGKNDAADKPFVVSVDTHGAGNPAAEETQRDQTSTDYHVTVAIEGMTCSSCVGSITRGLENLSYVHKINVDLVSNSGVFRISGRTNIDQLREAIEDLGYGADIVSAVEEGPAAPPAKERVVEIEVKGMHCNNCPDRVVAATLEHTMEDGEQNSSVKILQRLSVKNPVMQIAYVPHATESNNLRSILRAIDATDGALSATVYHPPTLEERSRRLQKAERQSIMWRLLFAGVVAIPTFIIGVVYMTLVSSHNATRMWFDQPIWGGNAARIEWALFIMTTPVMFFGADLFHRRASKEIWLMWRPGSKFPLLRRFYRFGSMNLLISAATMVAYIASVAVLISNAVEAPNNHDVMSNTYFDAVTFLTFFILIGRYLEAYSKAKTGDAVTLLGQLKPREALLIGSRRTSPEKIPVDQLEIGDHVLVQKGHSPPADGTVVSDGTFSFDESSLTGESKPVSKHQNDVVYAGTVNVGDAMEIKVTEVGGTSMLDHIISVVRSGQAKRAPIERFADAMTGYFVPVITSLAILTWIIWLSLGFSGQLPNAWLENKQGGWAFWSLEFAIAVFVIACPCGIGLAAPTALFVGGGMAAKRGILVQGGGQAFQEASHVDAVVFDKTGTLTKGMMTVVECSDHSDIIDRPLALAISQALENNSTHPIAQAIVAYANRPELDIGLKDIAEISGQGMKANVTVTHDNGDESFDVAIGNEDLILKLTEHDIEAEKLYAGTRQSDEEHSFANTALYFMRKSIQAHQLQGYSIAILAVRKSNTVTNRYCPVLLFAIADPLRPEAPAVIESLRSQGISVHMCTGDNPTTAFAIASQLCIPTTHVRPSALPQDKAAYIRALQHAEVTAGFTDNAAELSARSEPNAKDPKDKSSASSRRRVIAFVGDGLNDAPALSAADVSISLSSGSDIAMNASSFILLHSSLGLVLDLLALSRRVFRRVKLNFGWALVYNVVLVPVAAGVFFPIGATSQQEGWRLGPVWASLAMACSSVSVVLSSLALRLPEARFKGRK